MSWRKEAFNAREDLLIASMDGNVYRVRQLNGGLVWKATIPGQQAITAEPVVADGRFFATSIQNRVAGFDLEDGLLSDPDMIARAYDGGVPMGADLVADGDRTPRFLVWATRDPNSAPLQRLQIIKGWVENGEAKEQIFDVACSDGLEPDPATHRCPDNGATVDLSDCSISADRGAADLQALWTDQEFDAGQRAFYYVRVLENPSCRWSTWDAVRTGVEPREDLPATIQDRAWSSPIWFVPGS